MTSYNSLLKFILIGDSGVGKSCMLFQFLEDRFKASVEPTIGIEFGTKILKIGDQVVRLQIWDSAGQENYRSITRSYYRNTICAFLIYDITSRRSFESLKSWLEEARSFGNSNMIFVLIANKCDEKDNRQVSSHEGEEFAARNDMIFFETSAKESTNVSRAFTAIVEKILDEIKKGTIDPYNEANGIKVGVNAMRQNMLIPNPNTSRSGCC